MGEAAPKVVLISLYMIHQKYFSVQASSIFAFFWFLNPTHKTKIGTQNRW
jgi:hypothetical protein